MNSFMQLRTQGSSPSRALRHSNSGQLQNLPGASHPPKYLKSSGPPSRQSGVPSAWRPLSSLVSSLAPLALVALSTLCALAGCEPELDQRLSLLTEPRVIAVVSEPAETAPSSSASHRVYLASGDGPVIADVDWAFCTEPKPPTEDNVVNARCLGAAAVRELGASSALTAVTPIDACMRFGPDVSSGDYRPRDPDVTGGYYQPLRLTLPASLGAERSRVAFASHRIRCNLANAPIDIVRDHRARYVANANPPAPLLARAGGGGDVTTARAGERLELVASWPAGTSERYVWYDGPAARLRDRHESLRLSWYVTGGQLCSDATGRTEEEIEEELAAALAAGGSVDDPAPAASTANCWRAPDEPGPITLWLVLRDSRGGTAVSEQTILVAP